MSGIFGVIHRIFNATPPAQTKQWVPAAPAQEPAPDPVQAVVAEPASGSATTVDAYLARLAEELKSSTGVAKYLLKLEWDDFNRRNRPVPPTGVQRYLASQQQVVRPLPPEGPTGVAKYLASLESGAAA